MRRSSVLIAALVLLAASLPLIAGAGAPAATADTPVATDEATYAAYGRVFPDPQGCLAHDTDGDGVNDLVAPNASPWAKGNVCATQFLSYEELLAGARFLERMFPRYLQVIRLDEAFDNDDYQSAGLPRGFTIEDGTVKALARDRRPLYLFKLTDSESPIPEPERLHFVYAGGIHGPERAGTEGAVRAMEDLITWTVNDPERTIVEAPTDAPAPAAAEALQRSVVYFMFPNPDGWARGQVHPVEFEDGSPNLNYQPGFLYQRYNGNGMDLNRDWPAYGYTFRPYSPASEPETRAYMEVLRGIRDTISPDNPVGQRFAGGIDLHGMLTANAFSFTLLGAGQRDFRKNFSTVDQSLRAWEDQSTRLAWSPYIGTVFDVADQWGTVMDTIDYQVTGSLGDFFDNDEIGLGAVGIDNEMALSHIAPNSAYEPVLEQMHIDGNKGLIFSQMASMLTQDRFVYAPSGKIGYVSNPVRVEHDGAARTPNPGYPAQNDIDAVLPCQSVAHDGPVHATSCDGGEFATDGAALTLEFDVLGPDVGVFNGGITAELTSTHVLGHSSGTLSRISLQRLDEHGEEWETAATSFVQAGRPDLYLPAGQIVTVNDPIPGRWRARVDNAGGGGPVRVSVDFSPVSAESSPGQAPFSASSMDFFDDLNRYIEDGADHAEPVTVEAIAADPTVLDRFDTLVVVNRIGQRSFLTDSAEGLGLDTATVDGYFDALRDFAAGGGNLVLTDAALSATASLALVSPAAISSSKPTIDGASPRYRDVCDESDPLESQVCLPGTAGGDRRQAVEPTPLGYSPDRGYDRADEAVMDQWHIDRGAWEAAGGSHSASLPEGSTNSTGLGQLQLGDGRVVVMGAMFPDPNYAPGGPRDMRFGVASYALTFSAWQLFLNAVDHTR